MLHEHLCVGIVGLARSKLTGRVTIVYKSCATVAHQAFCGSQVFQNESAPICKIRVGCGAEQDKNEEQSWSHVFSHG